MNNTSSTSAQFIEDFASVKVGEYNDEGFLIVDCNLSRDGIQLYNGYDVTSPYDYDTILRVYRPLEEVTNPEHLSSFGNATVTNDHPYTMLTVQNWDEWAIGHCEDNAKIIKEKGISFVNATLRINSKDGIAAVRAGNNAISVGYYCVIEWIEGSYIDDAGVEQFYHGRMKDIRVNHIAVLPKGRAGDGCTFITDSAVKKNNNKWYIIDRDTINPDEAEVLSQTKSQKKEIPDMTQTLKDVALGDKSIALAVKDADTINTFISDKDKNHASEVADLAKEHTEALAVKDADLAKATKELEAFRAKQEIVDRDSVLETMKTHKIEVKDGENLTLKDAKLLFIKDTAGLDHSKSDDNVINAVYDTLSAKQPVKDHALANTALDTVSLDGLENAYVDYDNYLTGNKTSKGDS